MNTCKPFLAFFFILLFTKSFGQATLISTGSETNELIERLEILTAPSASFHSEIKNFCRKDATFLAIQTDSTDDGRLSKADLRDLQTIFNDNNEWLAQPELPTTLTEKRTNPLLNDKENARFVLCKKPRLKYFYKTPANFFEINKKYVRLKVNPILNFEVAKLLGDSSGLLFINMRGLELRGDIDRRLYFYTSLKETQARFPNFVNDFVNEYKAVPGVSNFKNYDSRVVNIKNGYSFTLANAYIGFYATKHIGIQFGHNTNFIGNGYRSMLLSDFAPPYFSLKINTQVWRIQYQNIFAELVPSPNSGNDQLLPRKYLAAHYLSYNFNKKISLGLYEAVVLHRSNHFELQYLNPIILYRTVESAVGSPDNALLGLNGHWNIAQRVQVYSQFLLDEFKFSYLILPKVNEKGWWANKYAFQFGAKYLNAFGIEHLDLQAELNLARPFTYAHYDSVYTNYAHFNQPLAHPLGSNFREILWRIKWQATNKLFIETKAFLIKSADDPLNKNYGNNWLLPTYSHANEFGNFIGQGIKANTTLVNFEASYQLFHNGYLDLRAGFRQKQSDDATKSRTDFWFGGGFRLNVGRWKNEF